LELEAQVSRLPQIEKVFDISQGFVSGLDRVFIRKWSEIAADERSVYMDFLSDRMIAEYKLPDKVEEAVFYPYDQDGRPLGEDELRDRFPKTWAYLGQEKKSLMARGPVKAGATAWWRPERPRPPKLLRRPKLVCPHIVLAPRFGIDLKGQYAVSRTPFLVSEQEHDELTVLKFYCAVLNAPVAQWFIRQNAPTFGGGYSRLEANLLRRVPVPSLRNINYIDLLPVITFVDRMLEGEFSQDEERDIHRRILKMYGLESEWQQKLLLA
jgi:hypothetical protein